MSKRQYSVLLIILGCLVSIIILHVYSAFFLTKYYGIPTGDIVLIITAVAIFLYTRETRLLRIGQSQPFISVYFEEYDLSRGIRGDRFVVDNDGRGTAANVKFKSLNSINEKLPSFRIITVLPAGATHPLLIESVYHQDNSEPQRGRVAQSDFIATFKVFIELHPEKFQFELSYGDIEGERYSFRGAFGESIPGRWVFIREGGETEKIKTVQVDGERGDL